MAFLYAHRGLHDMSQDIPENSLTAFRRAVEKGFGAELDVHLMTDGHLAVVHDSDLSRVCNKKAIIKELLLAANILTIIFGGIWLHYKGHRDILNDLKRMQIEDLE